MTIARILVVDDDGAARASARTVLSEAGYAVAEASSGRRALQQMAANPPDLLITDILMPDGDGFELVIAMKRDHPGVPAVVTSERRCMGVLDLFELARKLGADADLAKPLDAQRLLATVAVLLGSAARPR